MAALVFLGFAGAMVTAFLLEKRAWNNGISRHNGLPWRRFDTDSQGGRGYSDGQNIIWVSYPFIDGKGGQ